MGFILNQETFNKALAALNLDYAVYAPKLFEKGANFSDLDLVRYGVITKIEDAVFDVKSASSCKVPASHSGNRREIRQRHGAPYSQAGL